jgi:hypothetical protein
MEQDKQEKLVLPKKTTEKLGTIIVLQCKIQFIFFLGQMHIKFVMYLRKI